MGLRFFDYNATTPLRPEAKAAWCSAVDDLWLNPSSPYRAASRVRVHLEQARGKFAAVLGVAEERLVFNSGATEGNNAVFAHWRHSLPGSARIGVSPTEHPSVIEPAKHFFGERVVWLDLDSAGVVDADALAGRLERGELSAVSVMAANNETGLLNPWERIAAACRASGVSFHCDAAQWVGKMALKGLDVCDWITGCGHKFGGSRGVGFLVAPGAGGASNGALGGAQEGGRRAGTENVPGIMTMLAAVEAAESDRANCTAESRDHFIDYICATLPGVRVVGREAERLWNTVSMVMPEFASERWIRALEKRGFLVSAGSACSTGKEGPSPVLAALGFDRVDMRRVLRISSGWPTDDADWSALGEALVAAYADFKSEGGGERSRVISI